jgi:hypothetical protein
MVVEMRPWNTRIFSIDVKSGFSDPVDFAMTRLVLPPDCGISGKVLYCELPEPRKMDNRLVAVHAKTKTRWRVLAVRAMIMRPLADPPDIPRDKSELEAES